MNIAKRIGAIIAGVLLLAYICYHAFVVPYNSISTEQAVAYSARDTIDTGSAYIIRTESPIQSSVAGSYRYLIGNGERVAFNGVIANVYENETVVRTLSRIDDIERQIANLKSLNGYSSSVVVDVDQLNGQINDRILQLLRSTEQGNYADAADHAEQYLATVNRRQAVTGKGTDFSSVISSLESERSKLIASTSNPVGTVRSPAAGYFVSSVDGYEGLLTPDDIDDLTPEKLDSVKPNFPDPDAVGKVASDVTWYVAVTVSFEQALQFSPGDTVNIDISASTVITVPVRVERVNKSASKDRAVIVFSCNYMNSELSLLRTPSVRIVVNSYEGLRISDKATRIKDGKKGVYVSNGSSMTFVPIKELYHGNGYILCERADPLKTGLHIFDDVIVKGKDLYDGKSIS